MQAATLTRPREHTRYCALHRRCSTQQVFECLKQSYAGGAAGAPGANRFCVEVGLACAGLVTWKMFSHPQPHGLFEMSPREFTFWTSE